jgi:hypothetical protein
VNATAAAFWFLFRHVLTLLRYTSHEIAECFCRQIANWALEGVHLFTLQASLANAAQCQIYPWGRTSEIFASAIDFVGTVSNIRRPSDINGVYAAAGGVSRSAPGRARSC